MRTTKTRWLGLLLRIFIGSPRSPLRQERENVQPAPKAPDSPAQAPDFGPRQLARILGAIVAPTTLLTALLYYFGWSHAYWFFNYFGVDSSLLGFTPTDYFMRSVDALFVPMTVAGGAALLMLWGDAVLRGRLAVRTPTFVRRVLLPVIAFLGVLLAIGGFASVFTKTPLTDYLTAAPLSLASGVLLLTYSVNLWRALADRDRDEAARGEEAVTLGSSSPWTRLGEWAVLFVLVGLSLFWAATDYSAAVGRSRARQFVQELPSYPAVEVYSERSLSLHAAGVREVRCQDPQAAYHFRYDGLKLMLQSGDQYVFVPARWTPTDGIAIVIRRSNSIRLEFFPASAHPNLPTSAC